MAGWWSAILLLTAWTAACDAARFLAFLPFPPKSHHFVFRPVLEALAERGHQIVYVTGMPYDKVPANMTQIKTEFDLSQLFQKDNKKVSPAEFGSLSAPGRVQLASEMGMRMGRAVLSKPEIQKLIHSDEKFDAVILESFFVQEYLSAFIHKFNAVGIEIMPLGGCSWIGELTGLPDNIAYQIDYKHEYGQSLSFIERLYNAYVSYTTNILSYISVLQQQRIVTEFFNYTGWESRPHLRHLVSNRSLVLLNSHYSTGYPVPLAPHVKEIGGINVRPSQPLPQDLQTFMDGAKNGVIYMSMGSNLNLSEVSSNLRDSFLTVFINTFKKRPESILLKFESTFPIELPPNVKISKWFPQQDLLAHKNMKLFITHGGLLSINEAVHNGVPMFGIPFFADQPKNLIQVQAEGHGRFLRLEDITEEAVSRTIDELISNPKYKKEALRRSAMFRDRILSPKDEAVFWIEHALKYPNALTPKAAFLNVFVLHNLDVHLFILGVVGTIALISLQILCCLCRLMSRKKEKSKETPKGKKVKKH